MGNRRQKISKTGLEPPTTEEVAKLWKGLPPVDDTVIDGITSFIQRYMPDPEFREREACKARARSAVKVLLEECERDYKKSALPHATLVVDRRLARLKKALFEAEPCFEAYFSQREWLGAAMAIWDFTGILIGNHAGEGSSLVKFVAAVLRLIGYSSASDRAVGIAIKENRKSYAVTPCNATRI